MLHSRIGPTCRGPNVHCIRSPWSIKGGRPLEDLRLGKKPRPAEDRFIHPPRTIHLPVDVGYYAPAARTTLNRVFLGPCLNVDSAPSPSTSPSTPSLGIDGCAPPPGCGYPLKPRDSVVNHLTVASDFAAGAGVEIPDRPTRSSQPSLQALRRKEQPNSSLGSPNTRRHGKGCQT